MTKKRRNDLNRYDTYLLPTNYTIVILAKAFSILLNITLITSQPFMFNNQLFYIIPCLKNAREQEQVIRVSCTIQDAILAASLPPGTFWAASSPFPRPWHACLCLSPCLYPASLFHVPFPSPNSTVSKVRHPIHG